MPGDELFLGGGGRMIPKMGVCEHFGKQHF